MGMEIERKFLVIGNGWRSVKGIEYRQGYLSTVKERTVRVRTVNDKGTLTIKGLSQGASRIEFEYEIPFEEAAQLLDLCEKPLIEKKRYEVEHDNMLWEVDEFFGENEGLLVAEIELQSEEQEFFRPEWVGEEVTEDARYFNANLISHPYTKW
ncbi:MAG: CYTH domain-containing protein [SAR324 cluster bacterium]|nr:CYTH domain-containing protein [SAR324 cluster bacterium]